MLNVNAINRGRQTALHKAAQNGHEAVASQLLENGANIEAKDKIGSILLAKAIENGSKAVIELLLAKGAKVDYKYMLIVSEHNSIRAS